MNAWNNKQREPSGANPKASLLGALARSLRNWWDKFFWPEARPERSQSPEEAFAPVSVQEHEDTATPANLREPVDSVEDWLALVRERAPQLLLPPEEGGTPWFRAPEATGSPTEELGDEVNSMASAVQPLLLETPTTRIQQQAATHREGNERSREQGAKRKWFHFLRHKAEGNTESAGSTSAEPPLRNDRESSSAQVSRVGSRVFPKANSPNLGQDHQPTFSENHSVRMPARPVTESSRREVHKPSGAGMMLPFLRRRGDETNAGIPQEADLYSGAAWNAVEQATNVDRTLPKPASELRIAPGITGEVRRLPQRFDSRRSDARVAPIQVTRKAPRPGSHQEMWPALPGNGNAQSTLDKRLSFTDDLPVGEQNVALQQQPWSELRWPDLPEDLSSSDLGWMESFSTREHLHALDVEQQGGS